MSQTPKAVQLQIVTLQTNQRLFFKVEYSTTARRLHSLPFPSVQWTQNKFVKMLCTARRAEGKRRDAYGPTKNPTSSSKSIELCILPSTRAYLYPCSYEWHRFMNECSQFTLSSSEYNVITEHKHQSHKLCLLQGSLWLDGTQTSLGMYFLSTIPR